MPAANKKVEGSRNGPVMPCRVYLFYAVAGCHFAFFNDAEIASATATFDDGT
jgi:hypothetical protein